MNTQDLIALQTRSDLMRAIDAYAFDYARDGKLSPSRLVVERELLAALAAAQPKGEDVIHSNTPDYSGNPFSKADERGSAEPTDDQLTGAYWQGWCEAADWAGRDDLYADRDSQAYADAMNRRLGPIRGTTAPARDGSKPGMRERVAKAIYEQWTDKAGYVPWVDGGNSLKQDDARDIADAALAARASAGRAKPCK